MSLRVPRDVRTQRVTIPAGRVTLAGDLALPEPLCGIVLFAHGSGSSRLSPRNRYVAEVLQQRGIGTLLFDLLSATEALDRSNVFDIALLAERLLVATAWIRERVPKAPIAYFGASTGAAAALMAAARGVHAIQAIVSRGGRPDLAATVLSQVSTPTLLIVGGLDQPVLSWNEAACTALGGPADVVIVQGATHLFEEPGALEQVASLAADWLQRHLAQNESLAPSPAPRD